MKKKDKHIFKNLVFVLVAVMCVGMFTSNTVQAKGKVAINKTKVTVCTKKSYTLKITNASKKVKWTTSDKKNLKIKPSGKKNENCKVTTSNKKGTYTVTAKVGKKKYKATVKVAGHKYGKVSYKWNKGYSKCTASKKCTRCGKTLKQTVKTKGKTTTKATCTETGKKKYTAQFTKYNFGTKAKSVTTKVKGHKVNTDKKISYKWNSGYSKCTATYYCKNGGEKQKESVEVSKQITPATKTSEGEAVYTATFKTKGLKTQTKKVTIPKLAYLTLNGKEVNQISVGYGKPVTVTMCNDMIEDCDFTWYGTKTYPVEHWPNGNFDSTGAYTTYETETKDWPATKGTDGKINGNQVTISTKDKPAEEENLKLTITTSKGQTIQCAVKVMFTPGEYNFGEVNTCYHGYHDTNSTPEFEEWYSYTYVAYGKNKGLYTWYERGIDSNGNGMYENTEVTITKLTKTAPDGTVTELPVDSVITTDYIMDCNTRTDYDVAYNFYNHQKNKRGEDITLDQKASNIQTYCGNRADYKSKARLEWEALSYEVQENRYDDNFYNYVREKYGEAGERYHSIFCQGGGFNETVTTNAQLKKIVDDWTAVSDEVPSWYYYTAMSDWAEWSGADLGHRYDGEYEPLPPNYKD